MDNKKKLFLAIALSAAGVSAASQLSHACTDGADDSGVFSYSFDYGCAAGGGESSFGFIPTSESPTSAMPAPPLSAPPPQDPAASLPESLTALPPAPPPTTAPSTPPPPLLASLPPPAATITSNFVSMPLGVNAAQTLVPGALPTQVSPVSTPAVASLTPINVVGGIAQFSAEASASANDVTARDFQNSDATASDSTGVAGLTPVFVPNNGTRASSSSPSINQAAVNINVPVPSIIKELARSSWKQIVGQIVYLRGNNAGYTATATAQKIIEDIQGWSFGKAAAQALESASPADKAQVLEAIADVINSPTDKGQVLSTMVNMLGSPELKVIGTSIEYLNPVGDVWTAVQAATAVSLGMVDYVSTLQQQGMNCAYGSPQCNPGAANPMALIWKRLTRGFSK